MDYWNSVLLISIITMVGLAMIILFVGCKMWKNLVVTLLIATLIGFLIVCAINFVFGDRLQFDQRNRQWLVRFWPHGL